MKNTTEKSAATLPNHVNLEKWEEVGYTWSGSVSPSQFKRLLDIVPEQYQDQPIELVCELNKQGQLLALNLSFTGDIWTICQRCLNPLNIDVTHDAQLILLQREEQQSLVDEADDYLLLEELLAEQPENKKGDRLLPLKKLVEDELLLDVPLSAKHDDCEMAVVQVGEIVEEEAENPFAALASLKGKLS
ncbi:YceD family protein [Psychrobacter lutiphocae]|uniref:YceD family protein n=1 Tax=Psychrobacter lutiphocae TaxID=540500 RepID=UPI000376A0AA|nr:YceD family protein [Psychrobacter lutiphocae]